WQLAQLARDDVRQPGDARAWISTGGVAGYVRGAIAGAGYSGVNGRSESRHLEIEALVGAEGHRQIWADSTRSIRLKCDVKTTIRNDRIRHQQLGSHIQSVLLVV